MKTSTILLFVMCLLPNQGKAGGFSLEEALDSFRAANERYHEKEFKKALFSYKSLLNHGFESAELYFNLGNTYYKTERYALSIWSFEKALMLNPSFESAKTNLALANKSVVDKVQELPRIVWWHYWKRFKDLFGVQGWTYISVFMLWVFASGLYPLLTRKIHWQKRLGVYLSSVGLSVALFTGGIALNKKMELSNPNAAIIVSSNVYVKSAPEETSSDLYVIHSGLKVILIDQIGDWLKIKLADGKTGWVLEQEMKRL